MSILASKEFSLRAISFSLASMAPVTTITGALITESHPFRATNLLIRGCSSSEKGSLCIKEISEQFGEWDRERGGTTMGPRVWQVLGGLEIGEGELDGVEV